MFGSTPGGKVELLYDNPNRDSQLHPVVGDGTEFAFVEENFRLLGYGGWTLWYLPRPGAEAMEIDHGTMDVIPGITISGRWLVWTPGTRASSHLVLMDLATMTRRILASSRPEETQYRLPAIDEENVAYATVELAPDGRTDERHIYLMNLLEDGLPRRLDDGKSASEPAIDGDDVVWKESDPTLSVDVSGGLVYYSLATGRRQNLNLRPGPPPMIRGFGVGFLLPTVGDSYVAAWTDGFDGDRMLNLADINDGGLLTITDLGKPDADPHDVVVRPELAGDLLAYVFAPAGGDLQLRWVKLDR